jgi:hypothetical protein
VISHRVPRAGLSRIETCHQLLADGTPVRLCAWADASHHLLQGWQPLVHHLHTQQNSADTAVSVFCTQRQTAAAELLCKCWIFTGSATMPPAAPPPLANPKTLGGSNAAERMHGPHVRRSENCPEGYCAMCRVSGVYPLSLFKPWQSRTGVAVVVPSLAAALLVGAAARAVPQGL